MPNAFLASFDVLNRLTLALISLLSEAPKKDREKKMLEHCNTSSKRERKVSNFLVLLL